MKNIWSNKIDYPQPKLYILGVFWLRISERAKRKSITSGQDFTPIRH